uniref:hypothetical protein n=1 Tax=Streptococcus pneumoniae TaxID=1313 RepID=UPI0019534252
VDASYAKLGSRLQHIEKAQQKVADASVGNAIATAAFDKATIGAGELSTAAGGAGIALKIGQRAVALGPEEVVR